MTEYKTIGVADDVKEELDRLKDRHQSWTAFMEELAETYRESNQR